MEENVEKIILLEVCIEYKDPNKRISVYKNILKIDYEDEFNKGKEEEVVNNVGVTIKKVFYSGPWLILRCLDGSRTLIDRSSILTLTIDKNK